MIDWQPMSTAPRDRRILLAWAAGTLETEQVCITGRWDLESYHPYPEPFWNPEYGYEDESCYVHKHPPIAWVEITPVPNTLKASE